MLQRILIWMGFGLCHQIPERSFISGGIQAPVCARDTGIYVGFTIALAVIWLLHRGERPRRFPRAYVWVVMGLLVAFMGWDGVTSYAGLRVTSNALRLMTGLGVGFSTAVLIVAMLNDELWRESTFQPVLDPPWRLVVWFAAIPASYAVLYWLAPLLGAVYPVLVAVCILITLTTVSLVIVGMFPAFDRRLTPGPKLLLPLAVALALAIAEIALAAELRVFLNAITT